MSKPLSLWKLLPQPNANYLSICHPGPREEITDRDINGERGAAAGLGCSPRWFYTIYLEKKSDSLRQHFKHLYITYIFLNTLNRIIRAHAQI